MDIQKFTERSQGFLQAAGTIAIREFHQRITAEHLLKAIRGIFLKGLLERVFHRRSARMS